MFTATPAPTRVLLRPRPSACCPLPSACCPPLSALRSLPSDCCPPPSILRPRSARCPPPVALRSLPSVLCPPTAVLRPLSSALRPLPSACCPPPSALCPPTAAISPPCNLHSLNHAGRRLHARCSCAAAGSMLPASLGAQPGPPPTSAAGGTRSRRVHDAVREREYRTMCGGRTQNTAAPGMVAVFLNNGTVGACVLGLLKDP